MKFLKSIESFHQLRISFTTALEFACSFKFSINVIHDICRFTNWSVFYTNKHGWNISFWIEFDVPWFRMCHCAVNINQEMLPFATFFTCCQSYQLSSVCWGCGQKNAIQLCSTSSILRNFK